MALLCEFRLTAWVCWIVDWFLSRSPTIVYWVLGIIVMLILIKVVKRIFLG